MFLNSPSIIQLIVQHVKKNLVDISYFVVSIKACGGVRGFLDLRVKDGNYSIGP